MGLEAGPCPPLLKRFRKVLIDIARTAAPVIVLIHRSPKNNLILQQWQERQIAIRVELRCLEISDVVRATVALVSIEADIQ